jgi:hypothetical protein
MIVVDTNVIAYLMMEGEKTGLALSMQEFCEGYRTSWRGSTKSM